MNKKPLLMDVDCIESNYRRRKLAGDLLECQDPKCCLCAKCMKAVRETLGISEQPLRKKPHV